MASSLERVESMLSSLIREVREQLPNLGDSASIKLGLQLEALLRLIACIVKGLSEVGEVKLVAESQAALRVIDIVSPKLVEAAEALQSISAPETVKPLLDGVRKLLLDVHSALQEARKSIEEALGEERVIPEAQ